MANWTVKADKIINGAVYCAGRVIELDEQCAEFLQAAGLEIEPGGEIEVAGEADLAIHVEAPAPVELVKVRLLHWAVVDEAVHKGGEMLMMPADQAQRMIACGAAQDGDSPYEVEEIGDEMVRVKVLKRVLIDGMVRKPGMDLTLPESLALALVKEGKIMIVVEESETATGQVYETR